MIKESYIKLGEFIEQCNERNINEYYGADELRGINNEGNVMPSKANIIGVSFHTYKIAHKGYFIYNPARLDIGSISCLQEEVAIFSQMYVIFKIKEKCKNTLLTEYLWMWFKRKEFFRYVAFVNFGSVREMFTYEDMCNVMLPVPPIEEQRRIVSEYQTVERRIANNEALIQKLEETAQAIYHHTFVEGIDEENLPEGWRKGTLESECDFEYGKMPSKELLVDRGFPVYCGYEITKYYKNASHNTKTIVVIARGDAGSGEIKMSPKKFFLSNLGIAILPQDEDMKWFLYYYLKSQDTYSLRTGSAQAQVTINSLKSFDIIIPEKQVYVDFSFKIHPVSDYIDILIEENIHLRALLSLLTSKLS